LRTKGFVEADRRRKRLAKVEKGESERYSPEEAEVLFAAW
jgi:hypothetical protein